MGVVTWKTLNERIADGRGQGHHDSYKPWLWIRRKNVSGLGNQVADPLPGYRRSCHFLANVEWHVALLCVYLGAWDVREQFPLWPQPHPHPLADYPPAMRQQRRACAGLLAIANSLQIDHGWEIGSDAPYIATIDIAATLKFEKGFSVAGIALKPHEMILTAEPTDRIIERLKLEQVCMMEYEATHKVVDRSILGVSTAGNLEFLSSGARVPPDLRKPALQSEFKNRFIEAATHTSISKGIDRTARAMSLDAMNANLLWRHLAWRREIQIDITLPLEMSLPLKLGGEAINRALAIELFGAVPA